MTTRRRSSSAATTATKTATATVKKPTKSSSVKSKVTPKVEVTKYSKPEITKVTETPNAETPTPNNRRFATTRPAEPKITLEEYVSDFKVRMQINNYEVMEFMADVVKFYNNAKPVVIKSVDYVKDSYDRAFNQEEDKKQDQDS